jgi:uncharacterized protein YqjF (DUF2071 family)
MSQSRSVFLSAEWRDLVMLNYAVDPELLNRNVPPGTLLDSFDGKTYVSLVGFRFFNTKLFGALHVPFHVDFLEANLRFYVRRRKGDDDRRGVVFISEIVPKHAIAAVARLVYGENYTCLPMKHRINTKGLKRTVEYQWKIRGQWCALFAEGANLPAQPQSGSLEQFITEHYWGYSAQRTGGSLEYHVSHVPWKVWSTSRAGFEGDCSALYGCELGAILQRPPDCAFIADGSPVIVHRGERVK